MCYLLRVGEKIENKICLLPCFDIDSCHSSISTGYPDSGVHEEISIRSSNATYNAVYSHRIRTPQDLAKNPWKS
jgi:hypothetical protein